MHKGLPPYLSIPVLPGVDRTRHFSARSLNADGLVDERVLRDRAQ